jgi:hypothetical protein
MKNAEAVADLCQVEVVRRDDAGDVQPGDQLENAWLPVAIELPEGRWLDR